MTEYSPYCITLAAESYWQNWRPGAGQGWEAHPPEPLPGVAVPYRAVDALFDTTLPYGTMRLLDLANAGIFYKRGNAETIDQGVALDAPLSERDVLRLMVDERRTGGVYDEKAQGVSPEGFNAAAAAIESGMDDKGLFIYKSAWFAAAGRVIGRRMLYGVASTSARQLTLTDGETGPLTGMNPLIHLPRAIAVGTAYQGDDAGWPYEFKVTWAQRIPIENRTRGV